jgi:hypothetical protein
MLIGRRAGTLGPASGGRGRNGRHKSARPAIRRERNTLETRSVGKSLSTAHQRRRQGVPTTCRLIEFIRQPERNRNRLACLDRPMRPELIRFVTRGRHPPYGHRTGVFATAYELSRNPHVGAGARQELRALLDWFEANLAIPTRLAVSRHPRATESAISWVRGSADEHLWRLRQLVALVSESGIAVEELRTARPGYVVYQDDHQVVALPFADTPR